MGLAFADLADLPTVILSELTTKNAWPPGQLVSVSDQGYALYISNGSTWSEAASGSQPLVTTADYGTVGNGVTNDTAAVNAARTGAGVGGILFFPYGTYLVDGLNASVANQKWLAPKGTVIKLKNAGNAVLFTASATDVELDGLTFDANRANQTLSGQGVVIGTGAHRFTMRRCTVRDSRVYGIECFGGADDLMFDEVKVSGCHTAATNVGQMHFAVTNGSIDGITMKRCVVDGWSTDNGCVKMDATVTARSISRIDISDGNVFRIGDAGANPTLGVELFCSGSSSGSFFDFKVANNFFAGENTTNTQTFAVSVGGIMASSTTGSQDGSVSGNIIRNCRNVAVEVFGRGVSVADNVTFGSGVFANVGNNVSSGGAAGSSFVGNIIHDPTFASYIFRLNGFTDGVFDTLISGNEIWGGTQPFVACESGTITGAKVIGNQYQGTHIGVSIAAAATVDGLDIIDNRYDLTGSGATVDGVNNNSANTTNLTVRGNTIKAAGRHGVFSNVALVGADIESNHIHGCGADGVRTSAGCDRWTIGRNRIRSNAGTGIILAGSPTNILLGPNHTYANTTAQVNVGSATLLNSTTTGMAAVAANADTSGATLAALETEVNELKALLRTLGYLLP